MKDRAPWYDRDGFWKLIQPVLFSEQRQARAGEEVEKIIRLLQMDESDRILDLCCGNGRHSLEFSRRGFDVTGVDRTAAFIEQARSKASERNLAAQFEVGDMRAYSAPGRFDVIVNLFGSFGYFEDSEDDRRVAANMYSSLRPGGQFLIETMGKEILARDFREREWDEEGDLLLLSEKKVSQHWGRVETRWIAIRGAERIEHRVSVRSYSAVELSSLLTSCGFPDVRVYGSLDGILYDQAAQRLVVIGRKQVESSVVASPPGGASNSAILGREV